MKILPTNIDKFLSAPPINIKSLLIYGQDNGLVSERAAIFTKTIIGNINDSFNIYEISYDKIKDNLNYLRELVYSISLTGQRKLIKITSVGSSINSEFTDIISNNKTQNIILMIASELTPSSSVRKFFENSPNAAAIACYMDENAALRNVISSYLKQQGFTYGNNVIELLEELIAGDRYIVKSELNKLILYMGENKRIELKDIANCNINLISTSIEEFCQLLICKNAKSFDIFKYLIEENINIISIIRYIIRYVIKLYQLKLEVEKGKILKDAFATLSPPLFFKQIPVFTKAANLWSVKDLINLIENFTNLEINCKKTGNPNNLLFEKLLINMVK